MLASVSNRKVVAILLMIVGGLLVFTIFKMETLSSYFSEQLNQVENRPLVDVLDLKQTGRNRPLMDVLDLKQTARNIRLVDVLDMKQTDINREMLEGQSDISLLKSHEEQVKAGNKLHRLMITDPITYKCDKTQFVKNWNVDGWKFCMDEKFALKNPCLVYSVGINYDFSFDDAIGKLGCDVFSFDPSMNTSNHRRNPHVMFYQLGLGGQNSDTYTYKRKADINFNWKMRTLQSLMKMLGHSNSTIDLLKIDIETSEWPVVRNMIDSGVTKQIRQFILEWHIFPEFPPRETFHHLAAVIEDLKAAGFRDFDKHSHGPNMNWKNFNIQSDIGYVNINFIK